MADEPGQVARRDTRARRAVVRVGLRVLGATRLYRRLMLLDRPLDEPIVGLGLPPGVTVRQLDLKDVPAYCAFRPDADPSAIRRRLLVGEWAFAAWREGTILTAGWTSPGRATIEYLDRTMALAPHEGYSYDLYTATSFRGHGLASAARIPALRHARDQGCRRLLSSLLPENGPGWRTPATIGFRHIGWIGYVGAGPLRQHFCRLLAGALPLATTTVRRVVRAVD